MSAFDSIVRKAQSHSPAHQLYREATYTKPQDFYTLVRSVPDSGAPSWGNVVNIVIREPNIRLFNNWLQFVIQAPTFAYATPSGDGQLSRFVSASHFIDRIECYVGGQVIDVAYDDNLFLEPQMFPESNPQKQITLDGMGNPYSSNSTKDSMLRNGHCTFYIPLRDMFAQADGHICLFSAGQQPTYRIYLRPLAAISTNITTANILQCQIVSKVIHLTDVEVQREMTAVGNCLLRKYVNRQRAHLPNIPSGQSQITMQLSSVSGRVSYMYFFLRSLNQTDENLYNFLPVSQWDLRSSSGISILNGVISWEDNAYLMPQLTNGLDSTFTAESRNIVIPYGWTNVYSYAFCENARASVAHANFSSGVRQFTGAERLVVTLPSALADDAELVAYFITEGVIEQKANTFVRHLS